MTTDRFTKQPKTENINISLDSSQIHLKFTSEKKESDVFQGLLQDTSETSLGPPDLHGPPLISPDPKKTPRDPRRPFVDIKYENVSTV